MGEMLDYIDKLNELDTEGVEPMSHVFPVNNVFREDVVTNGDDRDNMLKNAPAVKDGSWKVPKTDRIKVTVSQCKKVIQVNRRRKHNADKEYDSPAAWADDKEKRSFSKRSGAGEPGADCRSG